MDNLIDKNQVEGKNFSRKKNWSKPVLVVLNISSTNANTGPGNDAIYSAS